MRRAIFLLSWLFSLLLCLLSFLLVFGAAIASAAPIVTDDGDAGFRVLCGTNRRTVESYAWAPKVVFGPNVFSSTDDNPALTAFAWYSTRLPRGRYAVYATWPARADAAADALYMISTSANRKGSFQDQRQAPSIAKSGRLWSYLDSVDVGADGSLDVKVTNFFTSGSLVIADAVLIEKISEVPAQTPSAVPAPWPGLSSPDGGKNVRSFNATYNLETGPLPRITAGGASLGAPELLVTQGGVQRSVTGAAVIDSLRGDAVSLHGTVALTGGELVWEATLEYDNLYKMTATIVPTSSGAPVLIEDLQFRWTLPSQLVEIAGAPGVGGSAYLTDIESTLLPFLRGEQDVWETYFGQHTGLGRTQPPVLWMGTTNRGVAWQAESDENYSYDHLPTNFGFRKLLQLERNRAQGTITMRVEMIHRASTTRIPPIAVDRPLRYSFAVQVTPVRPEDTNMRGTILGSFTGQGDSSTIYGWDGPYFHTNAGTSIPDGTSETTGALANMIGWYPGGLFPYAASYWAHESLVEAHPDWWLTTNQAQVRSGPDRSELRVSPSSADWSNRMLAEADKLLARPYVRGIYVDVNHIAPSDNLRNKDFVVDDWGNILYSNWHIWAHRSLMKRLYELHAQRGKLLFIHQHNDDVPAVHGWGHISLPGEDSFNRIGTDPLSYIEDTRTVTVQSNNSDSQRLVGYPLAYWQSLKRLGAYQVFLNQYDRASRAITADGQQLVAIDQNNPTLVRALIAMLGLHDLGLYGTWEVSAGDVAAHNEGLAYNTLMKEWRGATFHRYWEQTRFQAPNLLVSYYEKPNGRALVWVVNRTTQAQTATFGGQTVTVPAQDYRFLTVDTVAPSAPFSLREG